MYLGGGNMLAVIETHGLTKVYGKEYALKDVDVHIEEGDVYGLIGRNGAGKTTLMKLINRQILANDGKIIIQGQEIGKGDSNNIRIGSLIETPGMYPSMSAYRNLELKATLFGIKRKGYIEQLLDIVQLTDTGRKPVGKFSLGMKQRLGLAMALIGEPDILLLDEPTNGMDPQGIQDFRELILQLNRERRITMVISSHILSELSKFITRIGIIHEGQLLEETSLSQLTESNRNHLTVIAPDLSPISRVLENQLQIQDYKVVSSNEMHIYESLDEPQLISYALIESGILFDTFCLERFSLEEYFLRVTGGAHHA